MFDNKEIYDYLSNLSYFKGSKAQDFGWIKKPVFIKKILIFSLKNKFYFLLLLFFIILKRKAYLNFYTSKSKKTLIFDHSGQTIKKNLKIKNQIKKIFIPRRYIINSFYKYYKKTIYLSNYHSNNIDKYNLLFFIKTCFEINFCYEKYGISNSIISDDITPQSMAMIYISNTQIKNGYIELFNIPGAFFNRNFKTFEKNLFKYFDGIWFSTYDLVSFKKLNFQNIKNKLVFFKSYGEKLREDFIKSNYFLNKNSLDNALQDKKIYFALSSNYIGNEFNLFKIFRYTIAIYRSLSQFKKYLDLSSTKMYVLTHPSNSFSQIIIKILGYKKLNIKDYSSLNDFEDNIVMIGGNTSCLIENLIKGGLSIYCSCLDYYPSCYGLDESRYILQTQKLNKNHFASNIFKKLEINTNRIINM